MARAQEQGPRRARHTVSVKVLSPRWWFENRETGAITVAQFPNWPLWGVLVGWVVQAAAPDGSLGVRLAGCVVVGLWGYWGADELLRGVNPWRRLLGGAVVMWQIARLIS